MSEEQIAALLEMLDTETIAALFMSLSNTMRATVDEEEHIAAFDFSGAIVRLMNAREFDERYAFEQCVGRLLLRERLTNWSAG